MPDQRQREKMRRQAEKAAVGNEEAVRPEIQRLKRLTQIYGDETRHDEPVHVALKHYRSSFECFSQWDQADLAAFSKMIEQLRHLSWNQVYSSASKTLGQKTGIGYTTHDRLPFTHERLGLSEDITIFELRVTEKARVHGFRMGTAFFLILLDRDHRVC